MPWFRSSVFTPGTGAPTPGVIQLFNEAGSGIVLTVREAWFGGSAGAEGRVTDTPLNITGGGGATVKTPLILRVDRRDATLPVGRVLATNFANPGPSVFPDGQWANVSASSHIVPMFRSSDTEGIILREGFYFELQGSNGAGVFVWAWFKWFEETA